MIYEFTLSHPILGDLIISEPGGWLTTKLRLQRHNDFKSIIEYFGGGENDDNAGDFTFYGDNGVINGGIDFIREAIRLYGADTDVNVSIRLSLNGYTFNNAFTGQLALWAAKFIPDNKVQIPIIRNNFWTKFTNRLDQPVDIQSITNQDGEPANVLPENNITLLSQILPMQFEASSTDYGIELADGSNPWFEGAYYQLDWDNIVLDELDERFTLPQSANPELPAENYINTYGGEHRFRFTTWAYLPTYNFVFPDEFSNYIGAFLNINGVETAFTLDANPLPGYPRLATWSIDHTEVLPVNSSVRVYLKILAPIATGYTGEFWWNGEFPTTLIDPIVLSSTAEILANTVFPATTSDAFLIHDAAGQVTDRIIGEDDCFYSEYLGSGNTLYRQYEDDGCGWEFMLVKGLQLRQYLLSEKPFFQSFRQWWNGINPILNLGLGYETVTGVEVIRVEEVEYFYDRSQVSLNISNVREISSSYDEEVTLKTVKNGYKQWQSENISGIDDSQTKQTRSSRLQKAGKEMTDESEFIAASLAIETTRRMTRKKSADYKFDDNTFIVSVNPVEISPMNYEPKLDEGFSSITNLLNSETRYNSLITPARNFFRRLNLYSIGLQDYLTSVFKFTGGEGNYDMTSDYDVSDGCGEQDGVISEKMAIPVSPTPLHRNEVFEMVVPMEWEDYLTIRENRRYPIGVSQTDTGHVKMFIKDLTFEPFKSRATINAWTTEYFEIQVIPTELTLKFCEEVLGTCEDAILTEDSFELITEDGDCLVLE